MREILFRGKRIDNGEWVYGNHLFDDVSGKHYIVPFGNITESEKVGQDGCCYCVGFEVISSTVEQYTGLTDKNGAKIFEGDIIRYADYDEYRCYIESLDCAEENVSMDFGQMWTVDKVVYGIKIGYPAFDLNSHDFESNGLSVLNESGQYYYEVIGNIHDNPELLDGVRNEVNKE